MMIISQKKWGSSDCCYETMHMVNCWPGAQPTTDYKHSNFLTCLMLFGCKQISVRKQTNMLASVPSSLGVPTRWNSSIFDGINKRPGSPVWESPVHNCIQTRIPSIFGSYLSYCASLPWPSQRILPCSMICCPVQRQRTDEFDIVQSRSWSLEV